MKATRTRSRSRVARPGWFGVLGLLLGVLAALILPLGGQARAAVDLVRIDLDAITPSPAAPGDTVTVSGEVVNISTGALGQVRVRLVRSGQTLTDAGTLDDLLTGTGPEADWQSTGSGEIGLGDEALQPGEVREFTVSVTLPASGPSATQGVQQFGVQVRAAGRSGQVTVGTEAFLLPVAAADTRVPVGTVVELSAQPSMIAPAEDGQPALFPDEHLAAELGGRLDLLLTLAEQEGVTLLIDPALHREVTALAAGYRVGTSQANVPGRNQQVAVDWLARLAPLLTRPGTHRTLYGNPDVARAAAAGQGEVLTDALRLGGGTNPLVALPLAVTLTGRDADERALAWLSRAGADWILTDSVRLSPLLQDATVIPITAGLHQGGPGTASSAAQQLTRMQAQQLLGGLNGSPSVGLVSTEQEATLELTPAPFVDRLPLDELLDRSASGALAWRSDRISPPTTSQDFTTAVTGTREAVGAWEELVNGGAGELTAAIAPRAWSSAWPDEATAMTWLDQVADHFHDLLGSGQVSLRIATSWHLSRTSQPMPVTVINGLSQTITVRVEFASENPQRIDIDPTEAVSIGPGETATLRVEPRATGNGTAAMTARIVTAGGIPLGEPVAFQVTASSAGQLGWIIIVAAGVVLLVATAVRVKQVRRSRSATGSPAVTPDEGPGQGRLGPEAPATSPASAGGSPTDQTGGGGSDEFIG